MIALRARSIRVQKAKAKNKRCAECGEHLDKQKRDGKARYWVPVTTPKTSRWVEVRSPNAVIWLRGASLLRSIQCTATRGD